MRTFQRGLVSSIDLLLIGGDFTNIQHEQENETIFAAAQTASEPTYEEKLLQGILGP